MKFLTKILPKNFLSANPRNTRARRRQVGAYQPKFFLLMLIGNTARNYGTLGNRSYTLSCRLKSARTGTRPK